MRALRAAGLSVSGRAGELVDDAANERVEIDRPLCFVAVETAGQTINAGVIIAHTPYSKIEYWMHGTQLSQAEGEALCKVEMK